MERLELKAAFTADDAGTIEGVAWPFGTIDRTGDEITPTAFDRSVGKTLPMLSGHFAPVGVWDSVTVDGEGLKVKGRLLVDDVPEAKAVRALARAGAMSLSIGFITKKSSPRRGGGRTITDLEMVECSIVAVPANPGARITNTKEAHMAEQTATTTDDNHNEPEVKAADLKAANDNIAALTKRVEEAETKLARPHVQTKKDDDKTEETKAFGSYLRLGDKAPAEETKALTVSNDEMGGYLAPSDFQTEVIKNVVEFSPVRQAARVSSTSMGEVILPKRTGRPTGYWVGETEDRTETGSTYGQIEIPVHEAACYVDVSLKLLEDSAINIESEIAFDVGEEFGRMEGAVLIDGNGVKKPQGFLNGGLDFTASGNASTLGSNPADLLITHIYSMPKTYRSSGVWMMNASTLSSIRKLKDGTTGVYLWQPAYREGEPETLLGRPIIEAPDMPDIGSGTTPIAFGDFNRGYRIYDRVGLSIFMDPYTQRTAGKVRFHARRRVGGGTVLPEAIKLIKCATE